MDATAWDDRYAATELVWSKEPNQFVAQEVGHLAPARALDVACGEGRNAIWLAGRGWRVTASDFSQVAVDKGRQLAERAGVVVDWLVADALTADYPEVDLAVLAYLQLPPAARRTAIRQAFAALAPNGVLLVVAHDSTNLAEGTGGPQDPEVLYTAEDVLADLEGLPLEVVRAERVPRAVTVGDEHGGESSRTAWDALVHLRRG